METIRNSVFAILYNGNPILVTPIGEQPASTFLVDLEDYFILLENHSNIEGGGSFWTEIGKGITPTSRDIGKVIEEKNRNAFNIS